MRWETDGGKQKSGAVEIVETMTRQIRGWGKYAAVERRPQVCSGWEEGKALHLLRWDVRYSAAERRQILILIVQNSSTDEALRGHSVGEQEREGPRCEMRYRPRHYACGAQERFEAIRLISESQCGKPDARWPSCSARAHETVWSAGQLAITWQLVNCPIADFDISKKKSLFRFCSIFHFNFHKQSYCICSPFASANYCNQFYLKAQEVWFYSLVVSKRCGNSCAT